MKALRDRGSTRHIWSQLEQPTTHPSPAQHSEYQLNPDYNSILIALDEWSRRQSFAQSGLPGRPQLRSPVDFRLLAL
eukprot:scaffold274953_cov28-Prasinocladus_malaysianus.AAC.1